MSKYHWNWTIIIWEKFEIKYCITQQINVAIGKQIFQKIAAKELMAPLESLSLC